MKSSPGARVAAAVTLAVVLVLGMIGGSYALTLWAVRQADSHWCSTLDLLTARPVARPANPAANPSRQDAWLFYVNLTKLRDQFGCR